MSRPASPWSVLLAAALLIGACSNESRPTFAEWQPQWEALVSLLPAESELGDAPSEVLCGDVLAGLRTASSEMTPSPDQVTDSAVREWIEIAEMAFFECPPEGNEIDSMAKAYDELARIEAEIEAVGDFEG